MLGQTVSGTVRRENPDQRRGKGSADERKKIGLHRSVPAFPYPIADAQWVRSVSASRSTEEQMQIAAMR